MDKMRKKKNDYSIVIFFHDTNKMPVKMEFVHNIYAVVKWLNSSNNYKDWKYINIYLRRSGEYLGRNYSNSSFINPYP